MDPAYYEFGPFRLVVRDHELYAKGERVEVPPRLFDVLLLLVRNAGHLVTREELMKRLWPDTYVADGTLTQNVWLARRALAAAGGDDLIETVPRLGYRFAGTVRAVPAGGLPVSLAAQYRLVCGRKRYPLQEGENVIGRDPDVAVPIDDTTVSRRHARIAVSGATAILEDLGSKNGTLLRGKTIEEASALADGDVIGIGSFALVFRRTSTPASTRTAARR